MEFGLGKLILVLLVSVITFVLPLAVIYGLFALTPMGRNLSKKRQGQANNIPLEVTDQLRALQAQLDDVHARLDFSERVILEQREQLRGLGASEPLHGLREQTPV